ncbi:methyltransferase domain-containing protein [Patescibacteria group bacterium]|nr:methyltransferase domain-containing protein [Patescibacteria group bacterium]
MSFGIIDTMNTFSDPQKVIEQCDIFPGQHVADLGAGSGAYTLAIGRKIQGDPNSRVFAVDVQKDLLTRIDSQAREEQLSSVHIVWGDIEEPAGTRLRADSVHTVFIANILFQVNNKKAVIEEAKRILHSDGRIIVIDWSDSFGNIGPSTDHIISEQRARSLCEELGFVFEKKFHAGEHHYGFIMRNQ